MLTGDLGNDRLFGDGGSDILEGGGGRDRLFGAAGSDWLYGNDGDDRLDGGGGNDVMAGGGGEDLFVYSGGDDEIVDFRSDEIIDLPLVAGIGSFDDVRMAAREDGDDLLLELIPGDLRLRDAGFDDIGRATSSSDARLPLRRILRPLRPARN